jgi:hypothetical protein
MYLVFLTKEIILFESDLVENIQKNSKFHLLVNYLFYQLFSSLFINFFFFIIKKNKLINKDDFYSITQRY